MPDSVMNQVVAAGETRDVQIGFRSEDLAVVATDDPAANVRASAEGLDRLGDSTLVHAAVDSPSAANPNRMIAVRESAATPLKLADRFGLKIDSRKVLWFDVKTGVNLLKVDQ